ncbi:Transmembrane protein 41A [Dissophora ornata]|nr:Transmembrane protein 41A [Dissophora ornata]
MNTDTLNKGLHQHENTTVHRGLSLPAPLSTPGYSSHSVIESTNPTTVSSNRAHQYLGEGLDRINLVPTTSVATDHSFGNSHNQAWLSSLSSPTDQNGDISSIQAHGDSAPTICTGRSRSNTLTTITTITTTSTGAVDIAAASFSDQFDHIMRPRRSSLVARPSGPISHSIPTVPSVVVPNSVPSTNHTASAHSQYPPEAHLPQYHEAEESKSSNISSIKASSSSPWANVQLGFLPRIIILIGLFVMTLGGLYLLAQVLPPLSLPKSIDDVKVDAAILQEFATATYEGWMRTFWVFSVVYMWKQCFGIPGSAFLNILAGALYGPWFGTVLTSLLTTLGSVLAYFMSFFLMEPILNRYASSRLDQMRLQVQKKTMRAAGKKSPRTSFTGASTAIETSMNAPTSSFPSSGATMSGSGPFISTPAQRGSLRPSFTHRRTDVAEHQEISSSIYSYPASNSNAPSPAGNPAGAHYHVEAEIQESEGLLNEENNVESPMLFIDQQDDIATSSKDPEIEEEDQDDSEGTSLFMQLLLIRLFPLTPYWFINLASPLVGVPVIPFMTSMFLGCMPYNYICAQAGAILGEIHELRDIYQQPWILIQVVLVLVLSGAAVFVSKRTKKKQLEKERKSRSSEDVRDDDETTHRLLQQEREEEQQDSIVMATLDGQHSENGHNKRGSEIIDMTGYRY